MVVLIQLQLTIRVHSVPDANPAAATTTAIANTVGWVNPNYNWGFAKRLNYDGRTLPTTDAAGAAAVSVVPWSSTNNKLNVDPYNPAGPNTFTIRIPLWRLIRFF